MKVFGFDLAELFKAPKVTGEPEIPDPQTPMPVEYNEVDTSCTVVVGNAPVTTPPPVVPEVDNMHQRMYEISTSTPTTLGLNPPPDPWLGGSENFQGGSENLG